VSEPAFFSIFKTRKLVLSLFVFDSLIILLHWLYGNSHTLFHLDYEMNLPTFYQGMKLIVIGAVMLWVVVARNLPKYIPLSLILIYLGIDEALVLHENYEMMVYAVLPELWHLIEVLAGLINYHSSRWVLYLLPTIIGVFAYVSYISVYTKKKLAKQFPFLIAGFFLFALVIILEILNSAPGLSWTEHQILITFEETAEMFGASFCAYFAYGLTQLKSQRR